jgi:hypothetical protein
MNGLSKLNDEWSRPLLNSSAPDQSGHAGGGGGGVICPAQEQLVGQALRKFAEPVCGISSEIAAAIFRIG